VFEKKRVEDVTTSDVNQYIRMRRTDGVEIGTGREERDLRELA
jgi:hypothetical protein